jgi:SAM-dependent methyltransferase
VVEWDRFARLYDDDYGDFSADLELYLPFCERVDGPVLEVMCGTGRVLLPLLRAGHTATGVDISEAMIDIARAKLEHAQLQSRGHAEVGDVRALALNQRFALAIIAMNSFMHLPTGTEQLAALRSIRKHLQPGGLLIIDLFNPDPHELVADQGLLVHAKSFRSSWGSEVQKWVLRRTDFAQQTHYVEFMYDEIGPDRLVRRDVIPFTMRWLYQFELQLLLQTAGFELEGLLGSYELDDYTSDSERLIAIARTRRSR